MKVTVSLDSPSCEVTLLILYLVVYRDVTRQAKGLYRLKHVGALRSGLVYLSRYNSGWFCHTSVELVEALPSVPRGRRVVRKLEANIVESTRYV
jgi:hypothetical protein